LRTRFPEKRITFFLALFLDEKFVNVYAFVMLECGRKRSIIIVKFEKEINP